MFFAKQFLKYLTAVCLLMLSVSCADQNPSQNQETKATESPKNIEATTDNSFSVAVQAATEAARLTQTAKTYQQWIKISQLWQQAIDNMQAVSQSNSNYTLAQEKAKEYQNNKNYAQRIIDSQKMHIEMKDALYANNVPKVKELLAKGFEPNHYDIDEDIVSGAPLGYVLFHGAFSGRDPAVKELIKAGARWDLLNQENTLSVLLLSASCNGQPFIVQELIKAGADPNFVDVNEKPLMLANSEVCRRMENQGKAWNPGEANHDQVVEILKKAGAN